MDACCEECQAVTESSGHLFWECPRAHDIRLLSNLFHDKNRLFFNSFMDLMWYVVMVA